VGKSFIKKEVENIIVYEPKNKIPYEVVSSIHIIEKLFSDVLDDIYAYLEKTPSVKREYILLEEEGNVDILRKKFQYYLSELKPKKSLKILTIFCVGWFSLWVLLTLLGYLLKPDLFDVLLSASTVALLLSDYNHNKIMVKRRSEAAKHLQIVEQQKFLYNLALYLNNVS